MQNTGEKKSGRVSKILSSPISSDTQYTLLRYFRFVYDCDLSK